MGPVFVTPGRYTRPTFDALHFVGLAPSSSDDCIIDISVDGLVLELSGVVLDGEGSGRVGIRVHDCENVTIANGVIKGFHYGIHASNVTNLNIQDCVVSDNTNPIDTGWLPDTEEPVEEGFGGGIYLYRVSHSVIENNQVNNNFNGISLVRSDNNVIGGNHASYCGNVGIYLLRSSHNEVLHNLTEHCIRYTDRFWCDTADSAGILLEKESNHNRIIGNSLRYSGDGFFIRANRRHSSDHNFIKPRSIASATPTVSGATPQTPPGFFWKRSPTTTALSATACATAGTASSSGRTAGTPRTIISSRETTAAIHPTTASRRFSPVETYLKPTWPTTATTVFGSATHPTPTSWTTKSTSTGSTVSPSTAARATTCGEIR